MKTLALGLFAAITAWPANTADVFSAKDLAAITGDMAARHERYSDKSLKRYGNHYLLLIQRKETGSAELHKADADLFVMQSGRAVLLSGGEMIGGRLTKPGEIRGTGIKGGERREIEPGDVVHIPAGVPHQILVENGTVTYLALKISGQ